jgi:hypothetical protein
MAPGRRTMSFKIEETFQLGAPVDRVWAYLTDPRQVVTCLPGAELTSVESETVFLGKVKVKVGPIVAAYAGKITITELNAATYVVRMTGEGREAAGGGSAKMTMTSTLLGNPAGGTEVRVVADLDIVGKLAQFGRGMIESVNKQMFKQFTDCVRTTLEPPVSAVQPGPSGTAVPQTSVGGGPVATNAMMLSATVASAATAYAPPAPGTPPAAGKPVRLLPLLLRALWENIVALIRSIWRFLRHLVNAGT